MTHIIYIFFLMIRRQPRPTLFPYTTLFRSKNGKRFEPEANSELSAKIIVNGSYKRPQKRARGYKKRGVDEDRKSTRLNSSHTVISYAVFCLKKKKQNTDTDTRSNPKNRRAA